MVTIVDQGNQRGATQDPIRSDVLGPAFTKHRQKRDFPILSSLTQTTPVRRRYHTDNCLRDLDYCKRTRKRLLRAAQRANASCHHANEQENTKSRRKLEEKTFVTTKSARRLKKKSAHIMNATKTADVHSTTMKKTQQAKKIILKTGLNT